MIPYAHHLIESPDIDAVTGVLRSDWLTQGPEVAAFEADLARVIGARHVVAVSSGTAALHLACLAAGVSPGDVVIVPALTFVASANCALFCGAEVSLVDVDAATSTLDPEVLGGALATLGRRRVAAVVSVDFAGHPAPLGAISQLAQERGIVVIDDACHALGAEWRDTGGTWRRIGDGTGADMTVFSFHPVKHVTTGEGGAIATNRDDLAERVRLLRSHGITKDPARLTRSDGPWYYEMHALGFNYRITDFQCALGRAQLTRLPAWLDRRRAIARRYDAAFAELEGIRPLGQQAWARSAYHLYVVRADSHRLKGGRGRLFSALHDKGLGVQVHYIPIHYHPFYARRFGFQRGAFPRAEQYYDEAISLPLFPGLMDADVERVIDLVHEAVAEATVDVRP